jgi:putative NIF3 family GTP cyclohydrolase 1 type 2
MLKALLSGLAVALSLAACATRPPSPNRATTAATRPPVGCVQQTASRIPVKDDAACTGFGNTYTKQDLDKTGQISLDRALPMLDPAISRH